MSGLARELVSCLLHRLANRIHSTEFAESVEVRDEYEICRFRIVIAGDSTHGIQTTFEQLPRGWIIKGITCR